MGIGSGKGGGGQAASPAVGKDSLRTSATVHMLHALCEGPIWGFADSRHPLRCVRAGGTQVERDETDGQGNPLYNYGGVSLDYRLGYPDQGHIPDFFTAASDISQQLGLARPVTKRAGEHVVDGVTSFWPGPATVEFREPDVDDVSLRFSVDSLVRQVDPVDPAIGGAVVGPATVELSVRMRGRPDDGGWGPWVDVGALAGGAGPFSKTGKASSKYEWSVRVPLADVFGAGHGHDRFQVEVSRVTPDSDDQRLQNATNFEGLAVIKNKKLRYPGVALAAISASATQFGSAPTLSFRVRGLMVRVPSNRVHRFDPDRFPDPVAPDPLYRVRREYVGEWDGSFVVDWTDNPAWCLYDLLVEDRYGLGDWVRPEHVDKWELYRIGRYCDELVPSGRKDADGNDVLEPRFTLNCYIQTQDEAARVVQLIASAFHAMTYWAAGAVFLAQDRPDGPGFLFTPSNVRGGEFAYSATARRARHNACVVQWNDPEGGYRPEPELFEMGDRIEETGFRFQLDRVAFGCTGRGQALREARWALFTENHQTETVTFGVGMEGAQLRPGDIVAVMDPKRAGRQWGGRVRGCAGNVVALDREVELGEGGHNLILTTADGRVAEGQVISPPGTTDRLALFRAVPDVPPGAVWTLASDEAAPTLWRVVAVAMDGEGEYSVTALEHAPGKYDWVERGLDLDDRRGWTGAGPLLPPLRPPRGLVLSEFLYVTGKRGLAVGAMAEWEQDADAALYLPSYRAGDGDWADMPATAQRSVEIAPLRAGDELRFRVCARTLDGRVTPCAEAVMAVRGKAAPPPDVTGFAARADGGTLSFEWDPCPDLDFSHFELREAPAGATDWDAAAAVATGITANALATDARATRRATFLIKARDASGNWSENAAALTTRLLAPSDRDVLGAGEALGLAEWRDRAGEERARLAALSPDPGALDDADAALAAFDGFMAAREAEAAEEDGRPPAPWAGAGAMHLGAGGRDGLSAAVAGVDARLRDAAGEALKDALWGELSAVLPDVLPGGPALPPRPPRSPRP